MGWNINCSWVRSGVRYFRCYWIQATEWNSSSITFEILHAERAVHLAFPQSYSHHFPSNTQSQLLLFFKQPKSSPMNVNEHSMLHYHKPIMLYFTILLIRIALFNFLKLAPISQKDLWKHRIHAWSILNYLIWDHLLMKQCSRIWQDTCLWQAQNWKITACC